MRYKETVAFKLSEAERRKLDALGQATNRTRSGVLRELLRLAEPTHMPDLALQPEPSSSAEATT